MKKSFWKLLQKEAAVQLTFSSRGCERSVKDIDSLKRVKGRRPGLKLDRVSERTNLFSNMIYCMN